MVPEQYNDVNWYSDLVPLVKTLCAGTSNSSEECQDNCQVQIIID